MLVPSYSHTAKTRAFCQICAKLRQEDVHVCGITMPEFIRRRTNARFYFEYHGELFLEGKFSDFEIAALLNTYILLLTEAKRFDLNVADSLLLQ